MTLPPSTVSAGPVPAPIPLDIDKDDDSDSEGYTKVQSKKRRRRRSDGSQSPSFAGLSDALLSPLAEYTVLLCPTSLTFNLGSLSCLWIAQQLSALSLDQTTTVRVNSRKNIIAVDVLSPVARDKLLETSSVCGIEVAAFLPTPVSAATSIIRGVDNDITEEEILSLLKS